jgi:hypothetical protein
MKQLRADYAAARIRAHPFQGKLKGIRSQPRIRIKQKEKIAPGHVRPKIHATSEPNIPLHPFVMNFRESRGQNTRCLVGRTVVYNVNLFRKRVCGRKYRLNGFARLLAGIARQENNGNVQTMRSSNRPITTAHAGPAQRDAQSVSGAKPGRTVVREAQCTE